MSLIGSRGYRPALDGMRAVSVLTIMAFHIPWSWVHGGYWSVTVFFVVMKSGLGVMMMIALGAMRSVPRPCPGTTKSKGIAHEPNRSRV